MITPDTHPPAWANGVVLFPEELGLIDYPRHTERGLYPVEGPDGNDELFAPSFVVERDLRLLMSGLRFLLPPIDAVVPIAKGGGVVGQEAGYKLGRRNEKGRNIARSLASQTDGYDENDKELEVVEVISSPDKEHLKGMHTILIADDLGDKWKAMPAMRKQVRTNAPDGAQIFETAGYAKENGVPVRGIIVRTFPDKWIRFENQLEDDEVARWYMAQLFKEYGNYFEHHTRVEASKARRVFAGPTEKYDPFLHIFPRIPEHWVKLAKLRDEQFALGA